MPATAGTIEPLPLVFNIFEVIEEIASEVVVAFVVVELRPVKFWNVEDPVAKRLERVVRPLVTFNVPVRLARAEIVWPLMVPFAISDPVVKFVEKRLVDDAVVAKKFVVVAELPVAFTKVKFWSVDDDVTRTFVVVAKPLIVRPPPWVPFPIVVEAVDKRPAVQLLVAARLMPTVRATLPS